MRYKLLGRSGLRVSEICLGTLTFGEEWSYGASKEESRKIFGAFTEAGGNFIDTANLYTNGTSEQYVGEFVKSERDRFVVATKYTLNPRPDDPNAGGNHRKSLVQALHASLKRLGTDYIDLYWVHAWDFLTPVDEVMRALDDVVRSGEVLYIGISDAPAWIVSQANTLADWKGWSPFVGLQIRYSLLDRTPERDLLPMAKALDIGVVTWASLGQGVLTGKYGTSGEGRAQGRFARQARGRGELIEGDLHIAQEVVQVAAEIGRSPAQVALNWLRQRRRGVIVPIVGARTLDQIRDDLACLDFELPEGSVRRLDEATRTDLGFPHEFLRRDDIKRNVHGNTLALIDDHRNRGSSDLER